VSSNTASIASAMMPAADSTSILSICFSGGRGKRVGDHDLLEHRVLDPIDGGPLNTPWVAAAYTDAAPRSASCSAAATSVPPVSIMSSMSTQVRPSTSPTTSLASTVLDALHATLVHDRDVGVEQVGVALSDLHATGVGRHHHKSSRRLCCHPLDKHRHGGQVVDRAVEEPWI
jgi:hypothetical protein